MSQFLSQTLSPQMRLEQKLTPQLIQSMAVLQKPVADLEAYVLDALETNAALELGEPEHVVTEGGDERRQTRGGRNGDADESRFARLDRFAREQRDLGADWIDRAPVRRIAASQERDAKMGAMANTAGREIGLHEFLLEQWSLTDTDESLGRAGEAVIKHLDADGYLRVPLEEIAERVRPPIPVDLLKRALSTVQSLEPCGVGARSVIECLSLQLDALPGDNQMERRLITDHLEDITHNRLPAVAKATGYSLGEITEALKAMRTTLCLHPGYLVGDRSVPTVRPDVVVEYADSGDGLHVRLARGNVPQLRISEDVAAIARSRGNGKETREFARKHVDEAVALIDAVNFRKNRVLEVATAIAEKQRDFFDLGPEGLKVCRMGDLAEELGCDPSTISRTVSEKYMQTPRGIYPLRYFFTGGTEADSGEHIGWDRVKTRVRELIEAEDKKEPFNDDRIASFLKREGIHISRRTVAKYRQQLDIPSARQRKAF